MNYFYEPIMIYKILLLYFTVLLQFTSYSNQIILMSQWFCITLHRTHEPVAMTDSASLKAIAFYYNTGLSSLITIHWVNMNKTSPNLEIFVQLQGKIWNICSGIKVVEN